MNKSEKHDISPREKKVKRVKTNHSRPNISSLANVCIDSFHIEEEEEINNCSEKYKKICDEIRLHFNSILLAKKGKLADIDLTEERADICMLILKLKKLSRLDKHQKKKSRDAVNECKQKVDALNLQYQNLLYEVTHLQKEVTKCLEFRSKDEDIELVSVQEFYDEAPESISRPEITKADPHELTMARLSWELQQRKNYAVKLKEAEVMKEDYIHKIKKLKEKLSNILPTLNSIIEAAEPLQGKLGMPFQAMHLKHKVARFLPQPLYILYIQVCAYEEACDKKVQISVDGNVDEAKLMHLKSDEFSDDSDSDQEENTELNMHRHSTSSRKEETRKDILKKHPMTVFLTVEANESTIVIEFMYLVHLRIVTVCVRSISPHSLSPHVVGNLLQLSTILHFLFPDDCGQETPNLTNIHLFRKHGYEELPFTSETTGWPYLWAQKISGLEFLSSSNEESPCDFKSVHIESVVKAIRSRLVARMQLTQQITALVQKSNIPHEFSSLYPVNILSQLSKWSSIQWKDLSKYSNVDKLIDLRVLSKDCMLFNADIYRNSAHLSAVIVIPPNYPARKPVFLLQLFWKGSHTANSNFAIRELEEEINIHFLESLPEKYFPNLLVCQVYHLRVCFDVFLETEYSYKSEESAHDFVREKVVARIARGKSHSRPYKCVSNQKIFTFR